MKPLDLLIQALFCVVLVTCVHSMRTTSSMSKRLMAKFRRRRSTDSVIPTSELILESIEEMLFDRNSAVNAEGDWRDAAQGILSRISRSVESPIDVEIHRSADAANPGKVCGDCQIESRVMTFRKPSCAPKKILVRTCAGNCLSWEVPHHLPPYFTKNPQVCRPVTAHHFRLRLQGCRNPNDSVVRVSMAQTCECGSCDLRIMDCQPLY